LTSGALNPSGGGVRPKRARPLPIFSKCRARRFGDSEVVHCLADDPSGCAHALMFNSGTFCLHPDRAEFIARAKAAPAR
jgi:hypothetical protein